MQNKSASNAILIRRLSLVAIVLTIFVFGTEATLARLRQRAVSVSLSVVKASGAAAGTPVSVNSLLTPTVEVTVETTDSATSLVTSTPDAQSGATPIPTLAPTPAILTIGPNDQLRVTVDWRYEIGPRFPHTTIFVTAIIDGRSVGDGQVRIDCGTAVFNCEGEQAVTLVYTVPDVGGGNGVQQVAWPVGDYQLVVDRSDAGLAPLRIQTLDFRVR
jgi:hypothetical protein